MQDKGRGSVEVERPAQGVVVYRVRGFIDESLLSALVQPMLTTGLLHGRVEEFIDCTGVTGHDPVIRKRTGDYIRALRKRAAVHEHVLVDSVPLAIATWIMKLTVGGIEIYWSRVEFEAALADAVAAGRR